MLRPIVLVATALLWLAGCAMVPDTVPDAARTEARRVAVVAAVADEVHLVQLGFMVFGNDQRKLPIAAWGLDAVARTAAQRHLAARLPDKTLIVANADFTTADIEAFVPSEDSAKPPRGRIADFLRSARADLAIVIRTRTTRMWSENESTPGRRADHLGLHVQGNGQLANISPYVAFEVVTLDGASLRQLARKNTRETIFDEGLGFGEFNRRMSSYGERYGPPSALFAEGVDGPRLVRLREDLGRMIVEGVPRALTLTGF